jgi:CheY-like chemotaxis protein
LLQLATADAGRSEVSCEPFALDQLAADIESIMRPIADGKRLKLDVNWQSTAQTMPRFDEWRLRQIALNLVSNAVRYTNEGRVDVELIYDGRQMLLRVTDTGIGIAPEFQETIFEPLNRGALHGREGAGLGLSIVRQLVDQMGGKIAVQSALGVGSRFQVSLPQTDSSAPAAGVSSEPELRLPNRRILIIDDDSDVADMLVWSLGEVGFQVRALYDPMPVDAVVKEFSPGLLIVDIELGARSGLAITQDLRVKRFAGSIIVYSGASDAATQQAAKTAGADLFLAKPVDMPKFLAWMKKLLPTA